MLYSTLKKYSRPLVFGTALLTAGSLQAFDQPKGATSQTETSASNPEKASSSAVQFIQKAARDNDAEIAMAEEGARKAQNDKLRDFCKQLQKDHMLAQEQLRPVAQKYGVSLEQTLSKKTEKHLSKFDKVSGSEFDKDFAKELLTSHEKAIKAFEQAAENLPQGAAKQYAQKMIPKLQHHFQVSAQLAQNVGVDQSTITSLNQKVNKAMGGTGEGQNTMQGSGSSSQSPKQEQ